MLLPRILKLEMWLPAGRYVLAALFLVVALADRGAAETCTEAQITAAQEEGSAALKRINGASTPQIEQKMRELQKVRGWSDHDLDDKAYEQLEDSTIRALDKEMTTLITRMETLTEPSGVLPVCERLVELRSTLERMRDIAQQKSRHLLAKLDRELAGPAAAAPKAPESAAVQPQPPAPPPQAKASPKTADPKTPGAKTADTTKPAAETKGDAGSAWTTSARTDPPTAPQEHSSLPPGRLPPAPADAGSPPANAWPPRTAPGDATFTREEIFAAGEGVFGKVSSSLAAVLDFAFQKAGSPSGYIIGDEGGAAFLAGVRYGKGLLYLKGQAPIVVHWRGPSIGYDVGAAGSRMMVLVYNVREPQDLFTSYAGVDGSAYLVGGLGVTFLTNGKKAMAPIRSGLGLRFGANIGYLKLSHKPSWNPF